MSTWRTEKKRDLFPGYYNAFRHIGLDELFSLLPEQQSFIKKNRATVRGTWHILSIPKSEHPGHLILTCSF